MSTPVPARIIEKKRDGKELSANEIQTFVQGLTTQEVTDYQASAFLMATYFRGMSFSETAALTEAMLHSGVVYDLKGIPGPKVDKHSTGGVGDKVSLILAPLAAACGLKVPMMSGRGLGHSGGTLDKLESIPGFNVNLSQEEFEAILRKVGCAMIGQSKKIAPADRKLYAIRDVTATVECIPLIVASILSKKIAEGTEALILDVKVGSGAFMKTMGNARRLAKTLVQVSKKMGLSARALLTNMDQPLGYAVGNALEVNESIEILRGTRSKNNSLSSADLKEITLQLCAHMLIMGGKVRNVTEGRRMASKKLADGSAWEIFLKLANAQGVGESTLKKLASGEGVAVSQRTQTWTAKQKGYLSKLDCKRIGYLLVEMGGGRRKISDSVDPSVGFTFHKKLGSRVKMGDRLVTAHLPESISDAAIQQLNRGFFESVQITQSRKAVSKLVIDTCV